MNPDFIVNTLTAWDEPPRARHQFTFAAAKKFNVAFVTRNKVGWFSLKTFSPEPSVLVIEPYFPIDYRFRYRLPIINEFFQGWLYRRLAKRYPKATVVNFDCSATRLKEYFDKTVYYCNDEFIGNSKYTSRLVDKYLAACEKRMAGNAGFCVATAHFLTEKLKRFNPNTFEIPLGVSLQGNFDANTPREKNQKITVGFMGVLNARHNSPQALNEILRDPRFEVVLIGDVEKEFVDMLDKTNPPKILGVLKGEALFHALARLDVGLALYNLARVNPGTTPNKIWQYLAVGKPVVVSDLPNLKYMKFPDASVFVSKNDASLVDRIMEAYHSSSDERISQRLAFARQNSWDNRFEEFLALHRQFFGPVGS